MKCWLWIFLILAVTASASADTEQLIYSVVLVRGTDNQIAPEHGAKPASTRVAERLNHFRWKHYWEVRREEVPVSAGRPAKLQLTKERALGLAMVGSQVEMHLYRDGKLVRTAKQKVPSAGCEIMGGTDEKDSWFVVIRRKEK
jgi:hypothetical protein